MIKVEKYTIKPIVIWPIAAIITGNVLKGLRRSPIAGKNTGADCNNTAMAVNIPPKLMCLANLFFPNESSPLLKIIRAKFHKRFLYLDLLHLKFDKRLKRVLFD